MAYPAVPNVPVSDNSGWALFNALLQSRIPKVGLAPTPLVQEVAAQQAPQAVEAQQQQAVADIAQQQPQDWMGTLNTGLQNNANALIGLGTGLLAGKDFSKGLALGGQGWAEGAKADQAKADKKKALEFAKTNAGFLNDPALKAAVASGQMTFADAYAMEHSGGGDSGFTLGPGQVRFDAQGNVIASGGAESAAKPTSAMQEYQYAVSQGYQGTFQQYESDMRKAGAASIDFNANQGTAAAFADRMTNANSILSDPKMVSAMTDVGQSVRSSIPGVGNFLTSPEKQQAEQAQRDFVNAILRRESGAVISPSEFENAKQQYFPQPGDSPQVIAQKAQNRLTAIQGVMRAAGPNYTQPSLSPGNGGVVDWSTYFGGQ